METTHIDNADSLWDYFIKIDETFSKCKDCKVTIQAKPAGTTGNYTNHLRSHGIIIQPKTPKIYERSSRYTFTSKGGDKKKRGSPVWRHFIRDPAGKRATCKHCKSSISASSTTVLYRHIRLRHVDITVGVDDDDEEEDDNGGDGGDVEENFEVLEEDFYVDETDSDPTYSPGGSKKAAVTSQKKTALQSFFSEEAPEKVAPSVPRSRTLVNLKAPTQEVWVRPELSGFKSKRTVATPTPAPAAPPPQYIPIQYPTPMQCSSNMDISEFDAIGKNVAFKLAKMSSTQFFFAEALINTILRRGVVGKLTEETGFCEGACKNAPLAPPTIKRPKKTQREATVAQEAATDADNEEVTTKNTSSSTQEDSEYVMEVVLQEGNHNDSLPVIVVTQGSDGNMRYVNNSETQHQETETEHQETQYED